MTIKGTLETFNLREILQMLAFNHKVGTLVLDTDLGPHTIYVDQGRATFMDADSRISQAVLRILRREGAIDPDRIERAQKISERSSRFAGDVLKEMGLFEDEDRAITFELAVGELLFDVQLMTIHRFEFIDGEALTPEGYTGKPIEPALPVESLLLDLTRKVDQWGELAQVIPTVQEIFEGTNVAVDLSEDPDLDMEAAQLVVPAIDGYRTLQQISEASNVDLFSTVQVASALFTGGAIRPVPTDDILIRAEQFLTSGRATEAVPLLRRAIDRGDAGATVRVRVADALESAGHAEMAATELETFANVSTDADAPTVFQALQRAHALRGGCAMSAARLCDYYLRNRPWLREHRGDATSALRVLIDHGTADGTPREAADRLAQFIENGDVPSEDLLLLADLYGMDGRSTEAASALLRRAEDLLVSGRVGPARELFRRALDLDPTRADARRRLLEIDGASRRRRQRRRVTAAVVLFLLLAVGAGAAWWTYNQEAGAAVRQARELAEKSMVEVESRAQELVHAFSAAVVKHRDAPTLASDLATDATHLRTETQKLMDSLEPDLVNYASELDAYSASGHGDSHKVILNNFQHRQRSLMVRVNDAVDRTLREAAMSLQQGEQANTAGQFRTAKKALLRARNLGFGKDGTRERANMLLVHVERYLGEFAAEQAKVEAARKTGGVPAAFRRSVQLVRKLLDSDLTRSLAFPVDVVSEPSGAAVVLGGVETGLVTPCTLEYSVFAEDTTLQLRLPGRRIASTRLPSWNEIERDGAAVERWQPRVRLALPSGPRFKVSLPHARFAALWQEGDVPVVLLEGSSTVHGVGLDEGRLAPPVDLTGVNALRGAGMLPGQFTWRFRGRRTLEVQPPHGKPWTYQAPGLLEFAPCLIEDTLCVVDARGTVFGFAASTGTERWRRKLGGVPSQSPVPSALGVLVATVDGAAFVIQPTGGVIAPLAPPTKGHALALPLGDGAVMLGGGEEGCRRIDADGTVEVVGPALPLRQVPPVVLESGVAWSEKGGVRWLSADADAKPLALEALGEGQVKTLGGEGAQVCAVTETGAIRLVNVAKPDTAVFSMKTEGETYSVPLLLPRTICVLVDGTLWAIER